MKPFFFRLSMLFVILLSFSEVRAGEVSHDQAAPEIGRSEANGLSAPLYLQPHEEEVRTQKQHIVRKFSAADAFPGLRTLPKQPRVETALQKQAVAEQPVSLNAIFTGVDFEGLYNKDGVIPPDPNLAAGPNHVVQMVNMHFEIWDKAGNLLLGPTPTTQLWHALGGTCATENDGDGVVLYDQLAGRWVMTQFSMPNCISSSCNGPFYQCIAVSQTGDPTGAWYGYAFLLSNTVMNDYPKFSVWPDAYYMTGNQFASDSLSGSSGAYLGVGAYAFDRSSMLQGQPTTYVYFDLNNYDQTLFSMLPSNFDGPASTLPPSGTPNFFVGLGYNPTTGAPINQLEIWTFHVDWNNTANSTFTRLTPLTTAPFDASLCNYGAEDCITQPGTKQGLDAIPDRLMYRLQYRNFGSYEAMVANHTVDANGANLAGIRWYELRNYGSGWQINQQGTYSPDANNRWMGSIAMDGAGSIALGYSVSSSTVYPSIRYTGRLVGDPLGTMPQGEQTLISGSGSQLDSSGRWGDYSSMVVDPSDDRTFWYTNEYYQTASSVGWQTRIGSFKIIPQSNPTVTLSPDNLTFSSAGGAGSADVIVSPSSYSWTAVSNASWITITSGSSGAGNGTVNYSVAAYTGSGPRTGTMTIAGNTFTVTQLDSSKTFLDVPNGYWAENYIYTIYNAGITSGCGNSDYCPEYPVTRAQMAVFIIKELYGSEPACNGGLLCKDSTPYFTDVPSNYWAFKFIQKMKETGITAGCGDGSIYCPEDSVTRAEMAVFITKALNQQAVPYCTGTVFYDVNESIGDIFCRYVEEFKTLGITSGCGNSDYCPYDPVTRAQMAVFLTKAFLQ